MTNIEFDFNGYYQQNFLIPMSWIILLSSAFIYGVFYVIREIACTKVSFKSYMIKNPRIFFAFIAILLMIPLRGIVLANGGIHLLYEKASDCIVVTGKIEDFYHLSNIEGCKYIDANEVHHNFGERIIVNGTKYYLQYGELKVGDDVTMKVLPKSKLVLELTITDRQDDGS